MPGGVFFKQTEVRNTVNFAKLTTVVPENATCASMCLTLFALGGAGKFVHPSARLAVHSTGFYDVPKGQAIDFDKDKPVENEAALVTTVAVARFYKEIGVPFSIIGKLVATPPSDATVLGAEDFEVWNVKVVE